MATIWKNYQKNNPYAKNISYEDTVNSIDHIMEIVIQVEQKEMKQNEIIREKKMKNIE